MTVFALWSAPRCRSTAFFRSMIERGDLVMAHEPFSDLAALGETDVEGRSFDSISTFLAWLNTQTDDVFLKETPDSRHHEVLADQRFLTETRHAFLIRRPEQIAASFNAVEPSMTIDSIGLEFLHHMHSTVSAATGRDPIVIDSDDLVTKPAATMAAYCDAVGLQFLPHALSWEPGQRTEWRRSARWHLDVSASSGIETPQHLHVASPTRQAELARFAAHHRPFYELLHAKRIRV